MLRVARVKIVETSYNGDMIMMNGNRLLLLIDSTVLRQCHRAPTASLQYGINESPSCLAGL